MRIPTFTLLVLGLAHLAVGQEENNTSDSLKACPTRTRSTGGFAKTKKVLGYYPSYNYELQPVNRVNYALYTDMVFFVAVPEGKNFTYGSLGVTLGEKLSREFVAEAKKNKVTPLLGVGGWTGSRHFSDFASSDARRKAFAQTLVEYAQLFGYLGIATDWEYPNGEGIGCNSKSPDDTVNFGKLVKEVRKLWPAAQLTAAISINGLIGATGSPATAAETVDLVANLDFVDLMAYEFAGAWSETTAPQSSISNKCSGPGSVSLETGLAALLKQGFKAQQIVCGIPGFAKSWELASPKLEVKVVDGISTYYYQNKTANVLPGGKTDDAPGTDVCGNKQGPGGNWLVRELVSQGWLSKDQLHGEGGFTRHFDKCSGQPFLTNGKLFLSYDDKSSSVAKAKFAASNKLAGVYFFDTLGPLDETVAAARAAL